MLFCMFGTLKDAIKLKWFRPPSRKAAILVKRSRADAPPVLSPCGALQGKDTLQCCEQPFIQLLYCSSIIVSNWVAFANDILAKNGGKVKMLET